MYRVSRMLAGLRRPALAFPRLFWFMLRVAYYYKQWRLRNFAEELLHLQVKRGRASISSVKSVF